MSEPVIRIENVVVSYRDVVALRGVSLTVAQGEFVAIIGPNGAGKTTLLTIVNGLAHPHTGTGPGPRAERERERPPRAKKTGGLCRPGGGHRPAHAHLCP